MSRAVLFAEDPGAANWLAPLARELAGDGWEVVLVADGVANSYLRQRGFAPVTVPAETDITEVLSSGVDAVVVGTSENLETRAFDLVREAKQLNIPNFAVVDQLVNAELRFRGTTASPLSHVADMVFVADASVAAKFAELGLPHDSIVEVGNPHHEALKETARTFSDEDRRALRTALLPDWREDQRIVVFLAEVDYMAGQDTKRWLQEYRLEGRGLSSYRTLIVAEELVDAMAELAERPRLVVRLHPKSNETEFSSIKDDIDAFSQNEHPLLVCMCADLVVGMTTSLLEEAMLIGCNTLSILPRPAEAQWLPSLSTGAIPHVSTRNDLRRVLPQFVAGHIRPAPGDPVASTAPQKMARAIAHKVVAA